MFIIEMVEDAYIVVDVSPDGEKWAMCAVDVAIDADMIVSALNFSTPAHHALESIKAMLKEAKEVSVQRPVDWEFIATEMYNATVGMPKLDLMLT